LDVFLTFKRTSEKGGAPEAKGARKIKKKERKEDRSRLSESLVNAVRLKKELGKEGKELESRYGTKAGETQKSASFSYSKREGKKRSCNVRACAKTMSAEKKTPSPPTRPSPILRKDRYNVKGTPKKVNQ